MAAYFIRSILPKTLGILFLATMALAARLHLGWIDRTCDLWSPGSEERHNCCRNTSRESGQNSRLCILE